MRRNGDPDGAAAQAAEREAVAALCRDALPALLEDLVARTGDRAVAADVAAEAVAATLAAGTPGAERLRAAADEVLARAQRRGAVPDRARRRMGMPPLDLSDAALDVLPPPPPGRPGARALLLPAGGPPGDDLYGDLEAQVLAARHGGALPRALLVAAAGLAVAAVVAVIALAAGGGEGPEPAARAGAPCPQRISPALARQVPVLDAARIIPLPAAGRAVLAQRSWPVDHVQEGQARLINIEGDVRFWAVPVVSHGDACTPANGACVVAADPDGYGDAHCAWGDPLPGQRVSEQPGLESVIGFADPETLAVRVRINGRWTGVPTNGGVVATLLPLEPGEGGSPDPAGALPQVAVVDATGGDEATVAGLVRQLRRWGYPTVPRVSVGDPAFAPPEVRWRPTLTDRRTAARLARRIGTSALRRLDDGATAGAPLILVAGAG